MKILKIKKEKFPGLVLFILSYFHPRTNSHSLSRSLSLCFEQDIKTHAIHGKQKFFFSFSIFFFLLIAFSI